MQTKHILASCSLVAGLALAQPAAAIKCENGFQRIKDDLIQTPFCQDAYLAQVARLYGFTVSDAKIRNDPNYKKSICRYVFNDIRVQETCMSAGVPEHFGGH
jgi:hypothetical protein